MKFFKNTSKKKRKVLKYVKNNYELKQIYWNTLKIKDRRKLFKKFKNNYEEKTSNKTKLLKYLKKSSKAKWFIEKYSRITVKQNKSSKYFKQHNIPEQFENKTN